MLGVTAAFGEEVAAEPENLEGALRKMAAGLRGALGLAAVASCHPGDPSACRYGVRSRAGDRTGVPPTLRSFYAPQLPVYDEQ